MSETVKELWYMSGEVPMYGVFELRFSLDRVKKVVKAFESIVGSKSVVKTVSADGGMIRVELVDGRIVEVLNVPWFIADLISKVIYVLGSKAWDHLIKKQMLVLEEVGREAGIEKIKVSSDVKVEVREAVSIIDVMTNVFRREGYE